MCCWVYQMEMYKCTIQIKQKDKSRKVFTPPQSERINYGRRIKTKLNLHLREKGYSYPPVCSETSITIYLIRACSDGQFPLSGRAACVCVSVSTLYSDPD